jgi:prepilin-type N-terminal cleavage/methylation domain-containing protein
MKRTGAFTLIEMLMSTAVLGVIVMLAMQMTSGALSTVAHSAHRLESSEALRATVLRLRDELGAARSRQDGGRFLNLHVTQTEAGVALYLTTPQVHTADLAHMGFVTHAAYVWDQATRTLSRAEYHSARDSIAVLDTARSADSTDMAANLARLRKVTPSYRGSKPFDWIADPLWIDRLREARRNPLLTGVADWQIECFPTTDLEADDVRKNAWNQPGRLPAVLRLTFTINPRQEGATGAKATGRRYTSLVPLTGAEVVK